MATDFYDLLQIRPAASADVIRRAYLRLARDHHPDANPENEAAGTRFREILLAYETLRDPRRRAAYDVERTRSIISQSSVRAERNAAEHAKRANSVRPGRTVRPPNSKPAGSGKPFYPRSVTTQADYSPHVAAVGLALLLTLAGRMVIAPSDSTTSVAQHTAPRRSPPVAQHGRPTDALGWTPSVLMESEDMTEMSAAVRHSDATGVPRSRQTANPIEPSRVAATAAESRTSWPPPVTPSRDGSDPLAEFRFQPPRKLAPFAAELLGPLTMSAWQPAMNWTVQISIDATVIDSLLPSATLGGGVARIPAGIASPGIDYTAVEKSHGVSWDPVLPADLSAVSEGLNVQPPRPGSVNDYFAEQQFRVAQ